jgi:multidrug efflux system membrane fusion protein
MLNSLRWKSPRVTIPAAAALVAVLMLGWHWLSGSGRSVAAPAAPKGIPVDTAATGRADVPVSLEGLGTVQAYYTVTITARVDGQLQKVAFTEGQTVRQGDLLAQIDPRPYEAALSQATAAKAKDVAQLASAKSDLERYELLAPKNLASKQQLDSQRALVAELEAQIEGDQASIDNARTQLSYTRIKAPIDGVTGIRRVDPGNIVHATDTSGIVVVTQVQPITCIFTLPEASLPVVTSALQSGTVSVTAVSQDGKTQLDRGTLALVDNQIDQTTGTVRLKATFPNLQHALWPGEFVNAQVLVHTVQNALTVPTAAIQSGPDGLFTYVVKRDSTVEARPLQVGEHSSALTIVTSGLRDGERVVTSNQYRLQPGAQVRDSTAAAAMGTPAVAKGTPVAMAGHADMR